MTAADSSGRRPRRPGPTVSTLLGRGVTKRCPACGESRLFSQWFRIAERCPRCGLKFERIEGHWIGAIGMNTILTFLTLLVLLGVAVAVTFAADIPRWWAAAALCAAAVAIPVVIDPITRTLWTAIDIAMRPLEPWEVDWRVVDRPREYSDTSCGCPPPVAPAEEPTPSESDQT